MSEMFTIAGLAGAFANILSERDARIRQLEAALRAVEWSEGMSGWCRGCLRPRFDGHKTDCPVGIALAPAPSAE